MKYQVLLNLGWKVMIPIGLVWAMATGVIVVAREQLSWGGWLAAGIAVVFSIIVLVSVNRVMVSSRRRVGLSPAGARAAAPQMATTPTTVDPAETPPIDEPAPGTTREVEV